MILQEGGECNVHSRGHHLLGHCGSVLCKIMKLGMGRWVGRKVIICTRTVGHLQRSEVSLVEKKPLKSICWSSDFGLRVGITAIEAQQKMQMSRSGYAKLTINSL